MPVVPLVENHPHLPMRPPSPASTPWSWTAHGPEFIDADAQLGKNRAQLDTARAIALAPIATYDFITAP